ncbi:LysR family transcriptional regulator [Rhizobiales bacterium L72]|uniref:LysR family transcriptional regulator n=2 Tax=Propylenella binzhouense TaxID=2555902 RepID=A0A964WUN1_9HYPH|nr:LysR family transcriptional regulator [Propylenella binzhouense]MYZ49204.1 LysR family transcriptional regulator [Propylenella binzhouense]
MDIRQLRYLVALAREKHFTRAAAACDVTQPTLSSRIRQLENELGVSIVKRSQRYEGLTPEGERILKWARSIVENCSSLEQELASLKGVIEARAVLGVIPSALPVAAILTDAVRRRYPRITFSIRSQTSREVLQGLAAFAFDGGISYLDDEAAGGALVVPLYPERYRLFCGRGHPLAGRDVVEWREAARHPLGLLTPDMQNRRILDATFEGLGCRPDPDVESNSVVALYAQMRLNGLACILPEHFELLFDPTDRIAAIPLVAPEVEHPVGLLVSDRDPLSPVVTSLVEVARTLPVPAWRPERERRAAAALPAMAGLAGEPVG